MGGLGLCLCCKKDRLLTEHHYKELREQIMICSHCHAVIEAYQKLTEKYSKLIQKDRRPSVDDDSSLVLKNDDIASPQQEKELLTVAVAENGASDAAQIRQPSGTVPPEQLQALKELLDESKKKGTSNVDLDKEIEQQRKRHKYW
jgi:hypothetical protein